MPVASEVGLTHLSPTPRLLEKAPAIALLKALSHSVFRIYFKFPKVSQQFGESDNEKLIHLFS